jgi:hypothetical protein
MLTTRTRTRTRIMAFIADHGLPCENPPTTIFEEGMPPEISPSTRLSIYLLAAQRIMHI